MTAAIQESFWKLNCEAAKTSAFARIVGSSIANSLESFLLINSCADAVSDQPMILFPHQGRSLAGLRGHRASWIARWLEIIQEKLS